MKVLLKNHSKLIFVLLSILFVIPAIFPLLNTGFPITDDGNWMTIRFSAFYQALRSGQFPVRFLTRLNNGYGYPVADFLYPLFMYIATPIHVLGVDFINSIKTVLILSFVFSSLFCFLWLRKIFDNVSSLTGALFYTYFPYHLFDVYVRGSVGEALSFSILPFILWQIEKKSLILSSIGIFLLILSHNTLAVLFLPFVFVYMVFNLSISKDKRKLLYSYLLAFGIGFGMSAFFWMPALFDLKYTVFKDTVVSNWSQYFSNVNLIGYSTFFVISLAFLFIIIGKIQVKKHKLTIVMLLICLFSLFLATSLSLFLWNILPVTFIQFPFRFLSLLVTCVAFLSACIVSIFSKKSKGLIIALLLIVLFISAIKYLIPSAYQNYPDSFYSTNQDTTTVKNEYMPKWVKTIPDKMFLSKVENINGKERINIVKLSPKEISFNVNLPTQRLIKVNTIYFPGWVAFVNNNKTNIIYKNTQGVITLLLNKGQNNVKVIFEETPVRLISDMVSLLSLFILLGLFIQIKNKKINL